MLRSGANAGAPPVLLLPPLFAEMNRSRRLLVDVMAALAAAGIEGWLPDLPGTNESLSDIADIGWEDWRAAARRAGEHIAVASGTLPFTLALRGGALLDDAVAARGRWRLAPVPGAALLRDLLRARLAADREAGAAVSMAALEAEAADGIELAGFALSPGLVAGLRAASASGEARALALGESGEDGTLPGPPLWRRAEPGRSLPLSQAIAADVARWIASCAAS